MEALERAESSRNAGPGGVQQFSVRICVIECRDLKAKNKNMMSDPVCYIRTCGESQHTTIKKKTLSPYWEEMFFFDVKVTRQQFNDAKIQFQVFNANTFKRNELIGAFEFDLSRVYGEENHEVWRKWVGLYNNDAGADLQGYLRICITVLGPGDIPPNHDDDEDDEEVEGDDLQKMVLLPPQIERIGYELLVRAYRAEKLPKMDTFGKVDCFIQAQFAAEKNETDVVKENYNPIWNTELRVPVYVPAMTDRVMIRTMDWEKLGDPRPIATMNFKWSSIVLDHFGPAWVNTYGAYPVSMRDKAQFAKAITAIARINAGDIPASHYKGRVLLTLLGERVEEPRLGMAPIAPCEEPATEKYVLRFDLFMGTEIRCKFLDKVCVYCRVGHHELKSKKIEMKQGRVEWFQQFEELHMVWPKDLSQVPDIVIDIESDNTIIGTSRVGYLRMRCDEVLGWSHTPEWHTIVPDRTSSVYTEGEVSGFLLLNVNFGVESDSIPRRTPVMRPPTNPYQVRAHIYQARELPAADDTGTSDPFVMITFGGKSVKTRFIPRTLYPIWYSTLTLDVDLAEDPLMVPPLIVMVYDHNTLGSNDLIGRTEIPFTTMTRHVPPEPKWNELYVGDADEKEGELLASFQLIPRDEAAQEPVQSIRPAMKPCVVEFRCIGLRNLVSKRIFGISNPFLEVDCGEIKTLQKTSASNTPSATSPNLLEVMNFKVDLPLNPLYAPTLNCRAYDTGIKNTLLGTTSIPLGPYIPWSNEEKPQNNLPVRVDVIPGAEADPEMQMMMEEQLTPEQLAQREKEENLRKLKEKMDNLIPEDITQCNMISTEQFEFDQSEDAEGVRTMPDVAETKMGKEAKEDNEQKTIDHELEFDLKKPPFDEFSLWRGQKFGLSALSKILADKSQPAGTRTIVGKVKANLTVFTADVAPKSPIPAQTAIREQYAPQPYVVRCYILRGRQMVPVGSSGKASPYIKIYNGLNKENMIIDKDNKKPKTLKPDFYKCYQLPALIPGNSDLNIEVWDHNRIGSDDLMGRTVIDLETRLMCDHWRAMAPKPIEWRALWSPASSFPQGKIEMWLEIMTPEEARLNPPKEISPPKQENWELRVVVWNAKDVVFKDIKKNSPLKKMDKLQGQTCDQETLDRALSKNFCQRMCSCDNDLLDKDSSDIFVTGQMELMKDKQETDVHWRSQDGVGNFNWRLVFNVILPCHVPRLKLQIWDKNMLSANDSIAEAILHLGGIFKKGYRTKLDQNIRKQWIILTHPMFAGPQGQLELSIDVVNEDHYKSSPVGKGRAEPNQDPPLEEPKRPDVSFPPWAVHKRAKLTFQAYKTRLIFWGIIAIIVIVAILILILAIVIGGGGNSK
ncbi:putative myoferlin-like protein [Monocercomonoides exilis]|uniref:putative myoferlin-like protein n=1 Tax=Monocercomonoides exilis TaxID=2049356 RepID=UPI0035593D84|nr:putative myoferlin-like protein [Monocercomonoides exilis]|eukprot:MONOS_10999.1-p1 / transcript=MONOS_10999.1 / gene=MONOS_10999 / organism=Monocercomonoides_exilis_PA203 / gene_product=myoferlin-like protein / transcript_product=myoferlin-like protein / location=Mono_scaffold00527:3755-8493(+) / protein_length=1351 / sequence_SO=supercontig / SO=protein_coding / is_pseudo=false